MKRAKRFVRPLSLRERVEVITSHLATVFWLLSGVASCFICENHCIIKGGIFAMPVCKAAGGRDDNEVGLLAFLAVQR
jgi:hypothetical protein